ncbi:hypothetical protein [Saccharothrix syringae]|uniref:Uncharacterized protein n=1 Tax=Saccharothrix syringae TaxID=103733 RepID=A0A5Q0GVF7_SACSY|nr:hypothetical protein [Saccharothrix syringae]QFZ17342.1 hypothetical protein EKG83_07525 [Saccharothrix syringae]
MAIRDGASRLPLDVLAAEDDETSTVRAVFSWSYRALSPAAARLFRLLGPVAGPDVGPRAAAVLAGATEAGTRKVLAELVSTHTVRNEQGKRYSLHDLLRPHAVECTENDEPAEPPPEFTTPQAVSKWWDLEQEDLVAARRRREPTARAWLLTALAVAHCAVRGARRPR